MFIYDEVQYLQQINVELLWLEGSGWSGGDEHTLVCLFQLSLRNPYAYMEKNWKISLHYYFYLKQQQNQIVIIELFIMEF